MFRKFSGGTGSLIEARETAPIFAIIISLLILISIIFLIFIVYKKISSYKHSDSYKQKEINRITTKKDVNTYVKTHNLSSADADILWKICSISKCLNINYLLKSNSAVHELFRNSYNLIKAQNGFTDQSLNDFFVCQYKIEMFVAEYKKLPSTKQIPISSVIFYISEMGEQYPFCVIQNAKDFFVVEIPEFIYSTERKPKLLVRTRFIYKTSDGLSYNFISRIIRYSETPDNKKTMIIAHTDQLSCQVQRHYKREFFEEECFFSPIRINKNKVHSEDIYIYSDKQYKGKLSNISAGGCCIHTNLPIRENQHIGLRFTEHKIDEKVVGIIKRTSKLPNGLYALHIQFIHISLNSKNKIYTWVYKYEI